MAIAGISANLVGKTFFETFDSDYFCKCCEYLYYSLTRKKKSTYLLFLEV